MAKKKELERIEIKKSDNGGHIVTHYHRAVEHEGRFGIQTIPAEAEEHVFGSTEGHDMLAHVANALEIKEPKKEEEEEEEEGRSGQKGEDEDQDATDPEPRRMTRDKVGRIRGMIK